MLAEADLRFERPIQQRPRRSWGQYIWWVLAVLVLAGLAASAMQAYFAPPGPAALVARAGTAWRGGSQVEVQVTTRLPQEVRFQGVLHRRGPDWVASGTLTPTGGRPVPVVLEQAGERRRVWSQAGGGAWEEDGEWPEAFSAFSALVARALREGARLQDLRVDRLGSGFEVRGTLPPEWLDARVRSALGMGTSAAWRTEALHFTLVAGKTPERLVVDRLAGDRRVAQVEFVFANWGNAPLRLPEELIARLEWRGSPS